MSGSFLNRIATVRQGAYLPHWTLDGAIYHAAFRLADALPVAVAEGYRRESAALLSEAGADPTADVQDRLHALFSERIERYLDAGHGACWLARPAIAELTAKALQHFESARYHLRAWCVMPNHVHVVVQPSGGHDLSGILHSWKSFTAKEANRLLERTGEFWQKESYDRIVRDADDLENTVRYVRENPLKAGLHNWRWVWPT
jgi:REP element-mobilizing transposase RayT